MSTSDPSCACNCATDTRRETSWFRNHDAFRALATTVLPTLLDTRKDVRHLVFWSAACSSGQEAYSLAMILDERLPAGWTAEILATDHCARMVERVRVGRYSQVEMNRGLQANSLVKHFTRAGTEWQVAPQLREMVRAERVDLTAELPALPDFDVVFLCNALSRFRAETRQQVAARVRDVVATDGFLVLGTSETDLELGSGWVREPRGRTWVHRPAPVAAPVTADALVVPTVGPGAAVTTDQSPAPAVLMTGA